MVRELSYAQAIREAFAQLLEDDPRVFVIGQGLWSPWYVGKSMQDLDKQFGRERIIDSPVSENATTGVAIGAAIAGMRPIVVHPRMDFMMLAADQILNQASNWSYMFNGNGSVPLVIRPIINRGGEQGAQHSQSLHSWFAHLPGLKVAMPSTPYDAKGMLIASVRSGNPVLYVDDRWLYDLTGPVPEAMYEAALDKAAVRREGTEVTLVGVSWMAAQAEIAATLLEKEGISAEVIDLRTAAPIDRKTIVDSVSKTGRLVACDGGWAACGVAAEVAALVAESEAFSYLKSPVARVCLPPCPAPMSSDLEKAYYPDAGDIVKAARKAVTA